MEVVGLFAKSADRDMNQSPALYYSTKYGLRLSAVRGLCNMPNIHVLLLRYTVLMGVVGLFAKSSDCDTNHSLSSFEPQNTGLMGIRLFAESADCKIYQKL